MNEINIIEFESTLINYLRLGKHKIKAMRITQTMILLDAIHCIFEVTNHNNKKYEYQLSKRINKQDIKITVLKGG